MPRYLRQSAPGIPVCEALALSVLTMALAYSASAAPQPSAEAAVLESASQLEAYRRWQDSPHCAMLRRILPPGPRPEQLPEPESAGARAMSRYCVQCHYLPSPAMHTPENWPKTVERMVPRMQGKGNMGTLMQDMMAGVEAPSQRELDALLAYLRRHGQQPIKRARY